MRKFLILLLTTLLVVYFMANDVFAKRFGGGRSFGVQRSSMSYNRSMSGAGNAINNRVNSAKSQWMNRLAGFALGGLLAYLLMGHGLGAAMLSWLVIGAIVFFILSLWRQRKQAYQTPNHHQAQQFQQVEQSTYKENPYQTNFSHHSSGDNIDYPAGFNAEQFLREAKVQFIRLQAAHDRRDLQDISTFTTPEVFAEIQLQLQEDSSTDNQTEVVTLNAKLLDAKDEGQSIVASVLFSGLIREDIKENANPFSETWHFQKRNGSSQWSLAGIQQTS